MYYSYFGLQEAPFSIAVNPRYLYMSPSHRDALAHLLYGVGAGGGFILLTGEVGTGKTTINRCLLEQLPDNADLAIVLNPALNARDLLATVCEELGILPQAEDPGLKALTDALHRFLLDNHARGRKTVLMIDEAQHLSFDVLEQIRLLTNLETNEEKLLHIILIGQPELAVRLALPELRQLNQRITARYDLTPLSVEETGAYIRHRLHVAGLPPGRELFSEGLVRKIHRETDGVPRLINLLCDRVLLGTYGQSADRPDRRLLKVAVVEVLGPGERRSAKRKPGLYAYALAIVAVAVVATTIWLALDLKETPPVSAASAVLESERSEPEATSEALALSPGEPGASAPAPVLEKNVPSIPEWCLDPATGNRRIASLYGLEAMATPSLDPCRTQRPAGLECYRLEARTWARLSEDARPALLELVDDRRVEGRALFLGLDGDRVVLATGAGLEYVPIAQVAATWTGLAWRFWQRPVVIKRPLGPGNSGEDVLAVAELFARLDGQATRLSDGTYGAVLEERVRLFQEEQGLDADGVLGERTLRRLVLAAGDDVSMPEARRRLADDASVSSTADPLMAVSLQ